MTTDNDVFFGALVPPLTVPDEIEADQVAEKLGFVSRTPPPMPPKRRRGTPDPLHNFTMRLAMSDAEKFIRWCERERISYREAFGRLVAKIDG